MKSRSHLWTRLAIALLAGALGACGATDCGGCLAPLDEGFPEGDKVNGAVQLRLTPSGISFLNQKLPTIIQSFASIPCDASLPDDQRVPCPEGTGCVNGDHCESGGQPRSILGFRIPEVEQLDPAWCLGRLSICEDANADECLAWIELQQTTITPTPPAHLDVSVTNEAWSAWIPTVLERSDWWCPMPAPDCKLRIKKDSRLMSVGADLRTDNELQRLLLDIGDPSIPFDEDDVELDNSGGVADWVGCQVADLLLPLLFPLFEDSLTDALNNTIKDTANDMLIEGCDSGASPPEQCTQTVSSTCDGDDRCHFAGSGGYIPTLLGLEGQLDLAALLGEFAGDAAVVAFSAGAGGYAEVLDNGVEVGMRAGVDAEESGCVPPMDDPLPAPPRLVFGDQIVPAAGGSQVGFMVGFGVSDWLTDELVRKLLVSGAVCQRLDAGLSGFINTGALGLLASSLGRFTRGGAKPALIEVLPRSPFEVDLGLGTSSPDPGDPGRTILDQPLVTVRARDIDLDMYAMVDDRFVRFMTMRTDLAIGIGLADDGQGNLMLLTSGPEDWIGEVEVLNSELLTDPPEEIATAVPALVSAMMGQLAPSLSQTFEIPELMGFTLTDLLIQGAQPRAGAVDEDGNQIYEFVGLFANLDFDAAAAGGPLRYVVDTTASIASLELPALERFSVSGPSGLQLPEVVLEVAGRGHAPGEVEFTYRVNEGFWRPFHRGDLLHITDPILQLMGRHVVEVRGRLVGAPATLDPTPARLEVLVDPLPPEVEVELDNAAGAAHVLARDAITPAQALVVRHRVDEGAWVTQRGLAPIALETLPAADHRLDLEVIDEAGNRTTLSLGAVTDVDEGPRIASRGAAATAVPEPVADAGCGCASSPRGAGLAGLAALALLLGRRRRR